MNWWDTEWNHLFFSLALSARVYGTQQHKKNFVHYSNFKFCRCHTLHTHTAVAFYPWPMWWTSVVAPNVLIMHEWIFSVKLLELPHRTESSAWFGWVCSNEAEWISVAVQFVGTSKSTAAWFCSVLTNGTAIGVAHVNEIYRTFAM